jgi:hypothetical protein
MYAITDINGKVGGAFAQTLLSANQPVRALVHDPRARTGMGRICLDPKTFNEGLETHRIGGMPLKIYTAARTVEDCHPDYPAGLTTATRKESTPELDR